MKILVTGANGQLGSEIRALTKISKEVSAFGTAEDFIFTDIVEGPGLESLDITDLEAIRKIVREQDVKIIVNCAGYTNVNKAESDAHLCELLNADAPENLARAMKEAHGLLIHISTDYVFGGDDYNTPCKEDQRGTPTGVYGATKLDGELRIIRSACDYVIIRSAWLYSEYGNNFVKTMLRLMKEKERLNVVFDQVGTPTYALDLARAIFAVIGDYASKAQSSEMKEYANTGIYHYSNEGVCSWYDFAKAIAEYSSITSCDIQACHSDEFPSPVKRPAYSVLDKTKIKKTFNLKIPYWTDSLKLCLKKDLI